MQLCLCILSCSCSEVPWAVCSRLSLSHGQEVPFGGAESGPSMTAVHGAVDQLELLAELSEDHTLECLDAVKQLLCLSHFSPCEDGNQTAPVRPACGSGCTELFTGRCRDTWAVYLSNVDLASGAYKEHIEGCAEGRNDQGCATLLPPSEPSPTTPTTPTTAVGRWSPVLCSVCVLILSVLNHTTMIMMATVWTCFSEL